MDIEFYRSYLSKLVEDGTLELDEVKDLTDQQIEKLATDFMDKADIQADQLKEDYGN